MYNPSKLRLIKLDEKTQKQIYYYMPDDSMIRQLEDFFNIFSDSTRLKILSALSITEMCVNDISNMLKLNQTTVSHQLKLLKNNGAITSRRDGKIIFYKINDDTINDCMLSAINFILK